MRTIRKNIIPVIMDDRECAGAVPGALRAAGHFAVSIARLRTGDYLVDGCLLFERKTLPDFAASVKSGRLFRQAIRLAQARETENIQPALVLEGTAGILERSGMRREALLGALITISLQVGLPVLRTRSPEETVRVFRYAAEQGRAIACGALPRRGYRPKGKAALQSNLLQNFPGIGPKRAKCLLHSFGSIRAVMNARKEELTAVPGIGAAGARAIHWLVEEEKETYDSISLGDRMGWNIRWMPSG